MDFLATPDTVTGTAGTNTPGTPTRVGLLTDGTSPNDASLNWAKYYNMILEEVRQVIVAFGGTPDDENWHQASIGLLARFAQEVTERTDADDALQDQIGTVGLTDLQQQINDLSALVVAQQLDVGTTIINNNPSSSGVNYGVWAIVMQGRVPVGLDAGSGIWTNTVGNQFGALTHTLISGEMPSHDHIQRDSFEGSIGQSYGLAGGVSTISTVDSAQELLSGVALTTESTGGGGAHNNVQPSEVVVYWRRTA